MPEPIHYERGGERGVPTWNALAHAACGAELCDDAGRTVRRSTRSWSRTTCPDCRALIAKELEP